MKSYSYQPAGTLTVSTTGNIDDLETSDCAVIRMTNASAATIRGLKAGYPGQRVTIRSVGAGQVNLAHQNAGSSAANRLVNWVTVGNTPLAAGAGMAVYVYDEVTARWVLESHEQGAFISVTYNAGDFTASTGTWTVDLADVGTFAFLIVGKACFLDFFLSSTSVSATPANLIIAVPNGYTAAKSKRQIISVIDNLTGVTGFCQVAAAGTTVTCTRDTSGANWSIAVNATFILGGIFFELQ